jgi:hypothetical protein
VESFLVIIPALAQLLVNKTNLPIYSATLIAMSDDAVKIGLSTELSVPGGITVSLDPLELWLYNKDTPGFFPYTMVPMDKTEVSGTTEITVEDTTVGVGNRTELHSWLRTMLYQKTTLISVKGNTTAHLGALHFNINLKKTVEVNALDTLKGFQLNDMNLVLPPEEDGTNIVGNLTLPNWSDLNIGLGNVTLNVMAGELVIGQVAVLDVYLKPGNTTMPFRGEVFLPTILDNLVAILQSQSQSLGQGVLELAASGNSTIVDGEHITYLEGVLNEAHITAQVPIMKLLTDVLGSLQSGDLSLEGLGPVIIEGLGSILDTFLGGSDGDGGGILDNLFGEGEDVNGWLQDALDSFDNGSDDTSGEEEDDSNPFEDLFDELGGGSDGGNSSLSDLVGSLRRAEDDNAKRSILRELLRTYSKREENA